MRIILLIIACLSFCLSQAAESYAAEIYHAPDSVGGPGYNVETIGGDGVDENAPAWKFRWGPRASVDIFFPGKTTSTEPQGYGRIGWGGSAGIIGRYEWRSSWFVESGLQFVYGQSPVKVYSEDECIEGERRFLDDYHLCRFAIQLPIHGGYRFRVFGDTGLSLSTGVLLSCGIAGELDSDGSERLPEYHLYGDDGVWRRFGTAVVFGFHFDFNEITVGVTGNLGVTKMARRDIFATRTMNESEVRIDFTYWFGN